MAWEHRQGGARLARWRAYGLASLVATTALLLAACGGGGGGGGAGGTDPNPPPAVTLTADYYPLAAGDRRSWRSTAGADAGAVVNERAFDVTQLNGLTVVPVRDDGGATTYYQINGSAVLQVPGPDDDALLTAIGPLTVLRLGQAAGQTEVTLDRTVNADIDGSGKPVPVDVHVETTFVGVEPVVTLAGSFSDTAHVRSVLRTTVHPVGLPAVEITITSDDWYARGVGPVKNVSTSVSVAGTSTSTDEVFAWGVGGKHSESVAPTLVAATPVNGAYQAAQGPLTLQFSEAIDPLTVDAGTGLVLLDAAGNTVNVTRAGSGATWTLTPVSPLADGSYTWRVGTGITDLAGNVASASTGGFVVDASGPKLVASQPAAAATDAPLTGAVWMRFDEPVFLMGGSALYLRVIDAGSRVVQQLDATIQGNTVQATLSAALQRNQAYTLVLAGELVDANGNMANGPFVAPFRTDPGPLSRPQAIDPDAQDVVLAKVADLDHDGRPDLVMIVQYPGSSDLHLAVRKALAGGGLGAASEIMRFSQLAGWPFCQYSPPALEVLDVDGDGRPDVLLPCGSGSLVLKQAADGSFSPETVTGVGSNGAFAVDTDGSGRGRVVTLSFSGGTFQANLQARAADGSWPLAASIDLGAQVPFWLRYADIDGDGRRDLVWLRADVAGTGLELAWRLAAADGSLGALQSATLGTADIAGSDFADLDGDGVPELVISELYTDLNTGFRAARLRVWKRTPGGGYVNTQSPALYPSASSVLVADLDGDGRADVMVAQDAARTVSVLLQGSDGLLQPERLFEAGYGYRQSLAVTDVDGDGRRDLVVGAGVLMGRPTTGAWPQQAARGATTAGVTARRPTALSRAATAAAAGR